jgi:hypothetical protein
MIFTMIVIILILINIINFFRINNKKRKDEDYINFIASQDLDGIITTVYNARERRDLFLKYLAELVVSFNELPENKIKRKLREEGYYKDLKLLLSSDNVNNKIMAMAVIKGFNLHEFHNLIIQNIELDRSLVNTVIAETLSSLHFQKKEQILVKILGSAKYSRIESLLYFSYQSLIKEFKYSGQYLLKITKSKNTDKNDILKSVYEDLGEKRWQ